MPKPTDRVHDRLANRLAARHLSVADLAQRVDVDPKTVDRWLRQGRKPHPRTAARVAEVLGVTADELWPPVGASTVVHPEVIALYPHRAASPTDLWLRLLNNTTAEIGLLGHAILFLPEQNPSSIEIMRRKAQDGTRVRILLGDPDSPETALRGEEEGVYEAVPARIRAALAYYQPLLGEPNVEFRLHRTTLYNSIFVYDDDMLITPHVFGVPGYMAPMLHLQRDPERDMFDMYRDSFERVWTLGKPLDGS
ncbi:helix-turn-helix domain-containing protein [Myceligenerans salitolerans]|uniref:Helix-turn-helix transcriptional regulator n=1 Tax=Myceligenerans salitolerans TaxID=1230528 RepID=A0ABS3IE86_9MICO|nr:helix-turn-helix transcriptional regulator [Myceligenerans salitolerans]MBO0610694.1 helix-turn-helix transcriptional regulator [Myceligenerans salitolerans]